MLGGELHGLEEAGALVEHFVRLVMRLVGDLEDLVDELLVHDRPDNGLHAGAPYEYAALAPPGARLLFAAGACPLNDAGEVVGPGDYELQARAAIENLLLALEATGSGFEQVLKTTVYVASSDRAQLVRVWRVVEESFAPARPPSTLLGVAVLGYPGQLVEVEAVALASA